MRLAILFTSLKSPQFALQALVLSGLGGALLSSSILAGATLLLAMAGMVIIARGSLYATGWDRPRELRLLHFAFWFFVATSVFSWAISGFSYIGLKALGTHARLILFWPLVMALTYARFRASALFIGTGIASFSAAVAVVVDALSGGGEFWAALENRAGWDLNAITFGNLALLSGTTSLVGGLLFLRQGRHSAAALLMVASMLGLTAGFMSQTRSNFIALFPLLLLIVPLLKRRVWVVAVIAVAALGTLVALTNDRLFSTLQALTEGQLDKSSEMRLVAWSIAWELFLQNPLVGAGLDGYEIAANAAGNSGAVTKAILDCCTGHAHNDLLHLLATRGILGFLSWLLLLGAPLWVFSRFIFSRHAPTAHLAVAGAMIPVAYLTFGLTEATLNRSLFLTFYLLLVASVSCAMFKEVFLSYTRKRSVKVTATVITRNEAHNIRECLLSARQVADEIIVLDSGSTDGTVDIARQYADVVEITDWPGFGIQKQRALDVATGEWVLSIDADERVSQELASEINDRLAAPDADAFKLPWAVTLYGKRLDFGRSGRAPLRLFRREGVRFSDALVHERIIIPDGRRIKSLRGRLTHFTHRDFGQALDKGAKYAWLGAQEKYRNKKRSRWLIYALLRGHLTFFHVYIVRLGFLDGPVGYLMAVLYAQVTFNKYAGLWTLSRNKHGAYSTEQSH